MHRFVNSISVFLALFTLVNAFKAYQTLPARIPIHFNIIGRPDGWGGRWMIYFLPLLSSVITPLWMLGFIKFNGAKNLTSPMKLPYSFLLLTIVGGFFYINQKIKECAHGEANGLGWGFLPIFLVLVLGMSGWMSLAGGRS